MVVLQFRYPVPVTKNVACHSHDSLNIQYLEHLVSGRPAWLAKAFIGFSQRAQSSAPSQVRAARVEGCAPPSASIPSGSEALSCP